MAQLHFPSKPGQPADGSAYSWAWITLAGPDAQDFLHRLSTVNAKALQPGQGKPGFFLTAQGKVRSYFRLWRYGTDEFAFALDAGSNGRWRTELLAASEQYTVAAQFALTDATEALDCVWIFADKMEELVRPDSGIPLLAQGETIAIEQEIRICRQSDSSFGKPWITAWGRPARLRQWLDRCFQDASQVGSEELDRWRILAMSPRIDREITDATIPLEIGLRGGISENKGCYPGQEVIERIISIGSPARRLTLLEGEGPTPQIGSVVTNDAEPPVEVGRITSVIQTGNGFTALGLLKKIHAKEGLQVRFAQGGRGGVLKISSFDE